jgi:hypothetical protein
MFYWDPWMRMDCREKIKSDCPVYVRQYYMINRFPVMIVRLFDFT